MCLPAAAVGVAFVLATSAAEAPLPRLQGAMLEVYWDTVDWAADEWAAELRTMRAVGIRELTLRSTIDGRFPNISTAEPGGRPANCTAMTAFYPSDHSTLPPWARPCVRNARANAVHSILSGAQQLGMRVHLGLAQIIPAAEFSCPGIRDEAAATACWRGYAALQAAVFDDLWSQFSAFAGGASPAWTGVYTIAELENCQAARLRGPLRDALAVGYYKALSDTVAQRSGGRLLVSASPFAMPRPGPPLALRSAAGDAGEHDCLSAAEYAGWWGAVLAAAPHLGRLVPHDSVGIRHNSLRVVSEYFKPLGQAVHAANRSFWSSIELFEDVQHGGRPYTCDNVRTAALQRVAEQLKVESSEIGAEGLTCWEWHMYASPLTPGRPCPWNNASFYEQYRRLVAPR